MVSQLIVKPFTWLVAAARKPAAFTMSIFTGLHEPSTHTAVVDDPVDHVQDQIFPDNWICAPVKREAEFEGASVQDAHSIPAHSSSHEEMVLQRIESVLSNVLDDISKGFTPSMRACDDSTNAVRLQLQLSLTNSADAQRFCRAMSVLERVQVRSSALQRAAFFVYTALDVHSLFQAECSS